MGVEMKNVLKVSENVEAFYFSWNKYFKFRKIFSPQKHFHYPL
jgi:hypothetical protein